MNSQYSGGQCKTLSNCTTMARSIVGLKSYIFSHQLSPCLVLSPEKSPVWAWAHGWRTRHYSLALPQLWERSGDQTALRLIHPHFLPISEGNGMFPAPDQKVVIISTLAPNRMWGHWPWGWWREGWTPVLMSWWPLIDTCNISPIQT